MKGDHWQASDNGWEWGAERWSGAVGSQVSKPASQHTCLDLFPSLHTLNFVHSSFLPRSLCPKCLASVLHSLSPTCLLPGIFLAEVYFGLPQRVMSQFLLPEGGPTAMHVLFLRQLKWELAEVLHLSEPGFLPPRPPPSGSNTSAGFRVLCEFNEKPPLHSKQRLGL